ncbi:hypothetical protein [Sutterella wadsworthensis]|jgi:hypothetical protein|uniref:hypothetical protein n=2 Tax=Sutterella wadsworthensis TaxID=40545 RepID=UPI003A92E04C
MDGQAACMLPCFLSTGLCHVSNIPLVGSLSVKFHGKWDNLTFSRVSSRLAADVIIFLRIASLLQHAVFLIPIPTYYLCYSRNNFVFVWRFCFWDCHSPHDFGETALIDGQTAYCWIAGSLSLFGIILMILYVYVCRKEKREAQKHKDQSAK